MNFVKDNGPTCDISTIFVLSKEGGEIIPTKKGFCIYEAESKKFHIVEGNKIVSSQKF